MLLVSVLNPPEFNSSSSLPNLHPRVSASRHTYVTYLASRLWSPTGLDRRSISMRREGSIEQHSRLEPLLSFAGSVFLSSISTVSFNLPDLATTVPDLFSTSERRVLRCLRYLPPFALCVCPVSHVTPHACMRNSLITFRRAHIDSALRPLLQRRNLTWDRGISMARYEVGGSSVTEFDTRHGSSDWLRRYVS